MTVDGFMRAISAGCLWLLLVGCGDVGLIISKTTSFQGTDSIALSKAVADPLAVAERTAKKMGFEVSGLDKAAHTISFTRSSSLGAGVAVGQVYEDQIVAVVRGGGKQLDVTISVSGNFGNGTQRAADKIMSQFREGFNMTSGKR